MPGGTIQIRPYESGDRSAVIAFRSRMFENFPGKGDGECFDWLFERNPFGACRGAYRLAVQDGRIVGQVAAMRDRLWLGPMRIDCIWLCDLVVDPEYRGGPTLWRLFRDVASGARLALTTGIAPNLRRLYDTLGWRHIAPTRARYCVLRPTPLLAVAGSPEAAPAIGGPLRLALPVANRVMPLAQRLLNQLASRRLGPGEEPVRVECFEPGWDAELERFLERCGVTQERSAAVLNWRFVQRPTGRQDVMVLRHPDGRLRGMIVLRWMQRPGVARWIEVADYVVAPDDEAGFRRLEQCAVRTAVTLGMDFVRFRLSRPEHVALLRLPHWMEHTRPVIDDLFAISPERELLDLLEATPWHLTALAGDRIETGRDEWPPAAGPPQDVADPCDRGGVARLHRGDALTAGTGGARRSGRRARGAQEAAAVHMLWAAACQSATRARARLLNAASGARTAAPPDPTSAAAGDRRRVRQPGNSSSREST